MEKILFKRKGKTEGMKIKVRENVPFLVFPSFEASGLVSHGFSTRLGGVSTGDCRSMNFALGRGDSPDNIMENYRRMARALDVDLSRMVLSQQTHTVNLRQVTEADAGKGVIRERDYRDIDGLMTDVPGITLGTSYADCVPLFFLDPVRQVIASSHSGWRGTVGRIGQRTVQAMEKAYGCRPEDLIAGIGPSICADCYEVGEDVAEAFAAGWEKSLPAAVLRPYPGRPGKFRLDLQKANELILTEAGIRPENIAVTDICTCCNKELLFSHRGSRGRRGNMGGFLCLREH